MRQRKQGTLKKEQGEERRIERVYLESKKRKENTEGVGWKEGNVRLNKERRREGKILEKGTERT